ncbi:MAG: hypothetical protein ACRDRJ_33005 [Streptosporangiaceae bacterium]
MISGKVMTAMPQGNASGQAPGAGPSDSGDLPVQSQEDTDAGWGEQPRPEDDDRLRDDRPPHWDSA